jgi:hypothetical protein
MTMQQLGMQRQEEREFEASPGKVLEIISKTKQKQKNWECGSRGRVLASLRS